MITSIEQLRAELEPLTNEDRKRVFPEELGEMPFQRVNRQPPDVFAEDKRWQDELARRELIRRQAVRDALALANLEAEGLA